MSDEPRKEAIPLSAAEREVRDLVRSLPHPEPAPAFRQRLRQEFVTGALEEAGTKRKPLLRRPRVAAAFLIPALTVALALFLGHAPAWRLESVRGEGEVIVDGHTFAATAVEEIARRLAPGARVQLRGSVELDLLGAETMSFQLVREADVTLPRLPGRMFPRRVVARLGNGEARIVTGPRFRGATLRITSSEADIEVSGTTLAVIRDSTSTCVCTFSGRVRMAATGGMPEGVPAGKRRFIYNDGRPPALVDIDAMENMKLQMFHDSATPKLASPGSAPPP